MNGVAINRELCARGNLRTRPPASIPDLVSRAQLPSLSLTPSHPPSLPISVSLYFGSLRQCCKHCAIYKIRPGVAQGCWIYCSRTRDLSHDRCVPGEGATIRISPSLSFSLFLSRYRATGIDFIDLSERSFGSMGQTQNISHRGTFEGVNYVSHSRVNQPEVRRRCASRMNLSDIDFRNLHPSG